MGFPPAFSRMTGTALVSGSYGPATMAGWIPVSPLWARSGPAQASLKGSVKDSRMASKLSMVHLVVHGENRKVQLPDGFSLFVGPDLLGRGIDRTEDDDRRVASVHASRSEEVLQALDPVDT